MRNLLLVALCLVLLGTFGCTRLTSSPNPPVLPPSAQTTPGATPSTSETADTTKTIQSVQAVLSPMPPASEFATAVTNAWFPLLPGYTWVYRGVKDGQPTIDTVVVAKRKKTILGVPTTVVIDTLTSGKLVVEATEDWYAQDKEGNVWYFGEATKELENGKVVSTSGSWQAGVNGAKPGIYMPASPIPGDAFQQEFYQGQAEDRFKVLSLNASGQVPWGAFTGALLTEEWTPLEPAVVDNKYYVKGVGQVLEQSVAGPVEISELAKFAKK